MTQIYTPKSQPSQAVADAHIETLAAAFATYPLYHRLSAPQKRAAFLRWFYQSSYRFSMQHGGAVATDDNNAVVLWLKESVGPDTKQSFGCGFWQMPLRVSGINLRAQIDAYRYIGQLLHHEEVGHHAILSYMQAHHAHMQQAQHAWGCLWMGAVRPQAQGKGAMKQLVPVVLQEMRAQHLRTCFLTTELPENVQIWSKLGFREIHHTPKTVAGLPIWVMVQEIEAETK